MITCNYKFNLDSVWWAVGTVEDRNGRNGTATRNRQHNNQSVSNHEAVPPLLPHLGYIAR